MSPPSKQRRPSDLDPNATAPISQQPRWWTASVNSFDERAGISWDEETETEWEVGWETEPLPALSGDQSVNVPIPTMAPRIQLPQRPGRRQAPDGAAPGSPSATTEAVAIDELPTWILPSITAQPSRSLTSTRLQAVVAGAEGYVN